MEGAHRGFLYVILAAENLLRAVGAMQQEVSAVTPLTTVVSGTCGGVGRRSFWYFLRPKSTENY